MPGMGPDIAQGLVFAVVLVGFVAVNFPLLGFSPCEVRAIYLLGRSRGGFGTDVERGPVR